MKEYEFGLELEKKILYFYIRKPELREDITPQYFTSPILMDIARWVKEIYEKHPNSRLDVTSLRSLTKENLGKKRRERWPSYKAEVKSLFEIETGDDDIVQGQATAFANERKMRRALQDAEQYLNDGNVEAARRQLARVTEAEVAETLPDQGYDWPTRLGEDAFQGIAGKIIRAVLPNTEADGAGLLLQLLIGFGNAAGRNCHLRVGSAKHFPNMYCVLVGRTSLARKGTAWAEIRPLLRDADRIWAKDAILPNGLASGEGLIYAVRDSVEKAVRKGKSSKQDEDVTTVVDEGVEDKRRLILSTEFSALVRVMQKDGSILSETLRQAFDSGDLNNQSKQLPARATGAHISAIGHITQGETLRLLGRLEGGNGFVNRFLWVCVTRSKTLSNPPRLRESARTPLVKMLQRSLRFARHKYELKRSTNAEKLWDHVYRRKLSVEVPGLLGEITARGSVQILRLSLIYALLDCSPRINTRHLRAALAVWKYCESSAQFIFGESLGYPDAEKVLKALQDSPKGLSRTDVSKLFSGHRKPEQIDAILKHLKDRGLATFETVKTAGAPKHVWTAKRGYGAK